MAIAENDRAAFDRELSDRDPGFDSRATMIFTNLERLRPDDFDLRPTGRTEPLSDARADLLGPDAYAAEVSVSWAVPGDPHPSDQTVWLTIIEHDGRARWAGTVDGPDQPRPTPLWWLESIRVGRSAQATVIAGAATDLDQATDRAEQAAAEVDDRLADDGLTDDGPGSGWNGRLVLIMPSNTSLLQQTMGSDQGTSQDLAAITWPDGSQLSRAPMRIMINPAESNRGELAATLVLTHEAAHVATRSPASAAPSWLVEGFADYLAFGAHPTAAQPTEDLALDDVEKNGAPDDWPSEQDFDSSGTRLGLAYARSWLACRELADRYGEAAFFDFYQQLDAGDSIDQAAQKAFDTSAERLLSQWQKSLREATKSGS